MFYSPVVSLSVSVCHSCTLQCVRNVALFFFHPQPPLHHHHHPRSLTSFSPLLRLCLGLGGVTRGQAGLQGVQQEERHQASVSSVRTDIC